MADSNNHQAQAQALARKLWSIADELRGSMDASKFKDYILGTIFYRYLSERTERYMDGLLANDHITYDQVFAGTNQEYQNTVRTWSLTQLGYVIEPRYLFRTLVQKIQAPRSDADKFSIADFENAIKALTDSTLGQPSESTFEGLFNDLRLQDPALGHTVAARTELISTVISKINELEFDLSDPKLDILGTAYMILIGLFASDAGKKGGEFFTPTRLAQLVATLATVGLSEAKTVGDCTCGSASMLLEVQKHLSTHKVAHFYGQEKNASTYNLARMNMLMHGVRYQDFSIYMGDTLTQDLYGNLKLTVQVCNPPYSLKYKPKQPGLTDDPRYRDAGALPPSNTADLLFLEHMIWHMDEEDGRIAVLLPHGVLWHGKAEATIRKHIVQKLNCLDAVIGLPENLFHGTETSVCLLVLKANRGDNRDNIMFIDASKEFKAGVNQNTLEPEHLSKIVDTYTKRVDVDKFARVISMNEIKANNYNLNIPRYINSYKNENPINLKAIHSKLSVIADEKRNLVTKAEALLKQLEL